MEPLLFVWGKTDVAGLNLLFLFISYYCSCSQSDRLSWPRPGLELVWRESWLTQSGVDTQRGNISQAHHHHTTPLHHPWYILSLPAYQEEQESRRATSAVQAPLFHKLRIFPNPVFTRPGKWNHPSCLDWFQLWDVRWDDTRYRLAWSCRLRWRNKRRMFVYSRYQWE